MLNQIITKDIFRLYNCVGEFSFEEHNLYANFYLIQYIDGEIEIIVLGIPAIGLINEFSKSNPYCSIKGNLIDTKGTVHIKDAIVTNITLEFGNNKPSYALLKEFNNVTIDYVNSNEEYDSARCYLTNFINDSLKISKQFSEFKVDMGEYAINFRGSDKYFHYKQELYSNRVDVAVTSIADIVLVDGKPTIDNIDKLAYLLSYACKTQISPICFDYINKNILCQTVLRPIRTTKFSNKKDLIAPKHKSHFIEKCYNPFLENFTRLSLNISISIYLESLLSNYIDTSYVLLVQALEIFLASYEDWWEKQGNEIKLGSISRIKKNIAEFMNSTDYSIADEDLDELAKKLAYKYTTTPEKLSLIKKQEKFKDNLNLNKYDYDFPNIRNSIIHTGIIPPTINSSGNEREINLGEEYNRVVFLFDKMILSLLEYDEEFYDCLNENYIKF